MKRSGNGNLQAKTGADCAEKDGRIRRNWQGDAYIQGGLKE